MFEAEVVFVVHVEQCVLLWVPGEGFSEGGFPREQREHRVVGHEVGREEVDHIVLADGGIVHEGVEGKGRLCMLEQPALCVESDDVDLFGEGPGSNEVPVVVDVSGVGTAREMRGEEGQYLLFVVGRGEGFLGLYEVERDGV